MRWRMLLALAPLALGDAPLATYLEARANDSLLCVYLFNASAPFTSLLQDCPFGDLVPIAATPLSPRHGVFLRNTSSPHDAQLVSQSRAKASTIYTTAVGKGMTFELVARVYKPTPPNVNANLFALASPFDDCTNPGIRLEVSDRQLLVLIFYSLQSTPGGTMVCYEESFYSMTEADGACQVPVGTRDAPPPFVHLFASIVPDGGASWTTRFLISYVDATGLHTCASYNSMGGSQSAADLASVTGAYTLYIGNNAREPQARPPPRAARQFHGSTPAPTLPPTVLSLLQKGQDRLELLLPSSGGVFFSVNGKKVVDVDRDGIALGNNGTKYGLPQLTRLVSTAIDALGPTNALLKQKNATLAAIANTTVVDWARHPTHARYPPPNASVYMDVLFFAMAAVPMDAETLLARAQLSFPHFGLGRNRTLHIAQDTSTQLRLTEGAWNDPAAVLRLMAAPVRGTLQSCDALPTKLSAGDVVKDQCAIFIPPPGLANANMPLQNKYMVSQRREPFATVAYALAQEPFSVATGIDVFVDAAPAPAPTPPTAPTIVLVSPPYVVTSDAPYHGDAHFSMQLLSNADDPATLFRVTLTSATTGGALRSDTDGLASPTARSYCAFTPNSTALCLARDPKSDGVFYELHGERQSPTRLVFRGSLDQVRRALANVSLTNWRHAPHNASVRLQLQALESLETLVARTVVVHFRSGTTAHATTPCSNLFGFLPLCTESFGNGAVLSTLSLMALTACIRRRQSRTRQVARKKRQAAYQVSTQDEFTGILDQLLRIMLEPSLEGPTLLWRACRYAPEQLLCVETLVVVLSLQQAMPAFLAHLRNDPDTTDDVAVHARFFCKFMGRDWFNRVVAHAHGEVTTTFTDAFLHCVRQNLHSVPVEIRVLIHSIAPAPVVVLDWLLLPGLAAVAGYDEAAEVHACMETLRRGSADTRVRGILEALADQDAQYRPESKEPMVLHRDLLTHVLRHLHCLCAHHVDTMAKTAGAEVLDDALPPTGHRIRDVVLALGPISMDLPGLLALTAPGPLVYHP
ncbi:hypothetical protein SDRG_04498 [Saprolegnia diclina VS20]|uniref:Uncharacterized protein n=1 Tax=Saprolegnia diclina (strain VS20) TaxID=1156394 RepID=T0RZV0_SAPDV|nr:hypothetical protein SDRG_04498 [Saprolegnia diclina VS20]EQC38068.1 hypothetical protein SDRG_04498 [Saprolegnia diclina VS20]|eukprot:XP_008608395.1 hypothetical protein SDRG_04498 [Saprolegnia diclina VS20]